MEEILQEIATIGGKPGLYKIVKPSRTGVIVESLNEAKKKEMISVNAKVSVLKDISIYKEAFDESTPLSDIFMKMKELHGSAIELDIKKASKADFFTFFGEVMPDFDKEKVYDSDIKKMINWFNILNKEIPEAFEVAKPKAKKAVAKAAPKTAKAKAKPKPKAKKA